LVVADCRPALGHSGFYEPAEFAGVLAKHGVDGVGTHGDFDSSLVSAAGGLEVALDEITILDAGVEYDRVMLMSKARKITVKVSAELLE
jgi:hypothetical protein